MVVSFPLLARKGCNIKAAVIATNEQGYGHKRPTDVAEPVDVAVVLITPSTTQRGPLNSVRWLTDSIQTLGKGHMFPAWHTTRRSFTRSKGALLGSAARKLINQMHELISLSFPHHWRRFLLPVLTIFSPALPCRKQAYYLFRCTCEVYKCEAKPSAVF